METKDLAIIGKNLYGPRLHIPAQNEHRFWSKVNTYTE